jgi:conjugative relaxase-like TrwC/TraI family protein
MTAASIGAAKGGGYARYLEAKTVEPERGDYYLAPGGEPAQAPGRWLASSETLGRLGIESSAVDGPDFVALMEGRHPQTGRWLRPEGAGGGRGGGIDLTFSAPKSVSAVWALGDDAQRRDMEVAHAAAVQEALGYLTEMVPTVRRRYGGQVVEEPARELVAAEYLHTTARGVMDGDAPDPQLHSHVVVTSAVRDDGRIVAVASRPIFRSAREVGAFYRSALADQITQRGYAIDAGTGNHGRYFEIAGVPRGLLEAFSARSREVARAAERFRARYGRAPERDELRRVKLENARPRSPSPVRTCSRCGMRRQHASASPASRQRCCWTRHAARGQSVLSRIASRSASPSGPRRSSLASSVPCCSSSQWVNSRPRRRLRARGR